MSASAEISQRPRAAIAEVCFQNAKIVDGTGAAPFFGDVEVTGDRITGVHLPYKGTGQRIIDATSLVLCPGFIDIHSHADYTLLADGRAHSAVLQGVTSVVIGNCGHGIAPCTSMSQDLIPMNVFGWRRDWEVATQWKSFAEYLDVLRQRGVAVNVFPLVAHGAVRMAIAGFSSRPLSAAELKTGQSMVRDALSAGAVGLSTGLEYAPGTSADEAELLALAEPLGEFNAIYATHCRNRTDHMVEAARESVTIATRSGARLQLSHYVRRPYGPPDCDRRAWEYLEEVTARGLEVKADVFPFEFGPTPLSVLIPMKFRSGSRAIVAERLRSGEVQQAILRELDPMLTNALAAGQATGMFVTNDGTASGRYVGLSLAEVAKDMQLSVEEASLHLLARAGEDFYSVTVVEPWVDPDDLVSSLADERFFIMGDGTSGALNGPLHAHRFSPSDWGFAPAFLGRYVRDATLMPLESAIAKMTSGPARQLRLHDRGVVKPGLKADLVLFDYDSIDTQVSPSNTRCCPVGIRDVMVNGAFVVRASQPTHAKPGQVAKN